jgi:two-component system, LytTR family, response regulator LytT
MESEISILIIEDEALIAQNIKMQLESFGYGIAGVCYKYSNALKAINETQYDAVITDINLGNGIDEKSGIQIAQQIKQIKNCPIIFLTAFSDKDTIKKAAALAPSAYLVKPVNAANLFAAVQLAVDNFANKTVAVPEETVAPKYFFVKQGTSLVKIFWEDVYHIKYVKNYVKIKSTQHQTPFLIRSFLKQFLETMLPPMYKNNFVKINRAEVIAKKTIVKIDKEFVETIYGKYKVGSDFDKDDL